MRDFSTIDAAIAPGIDSEDQAFQRLYGPWHPFTAGQAAHALESYDHEWWVCGGSAIEAFTGVQRHHEDLDIGFFARDLADLRATLEPSFDLWSTGDGTLRPLNADHPELHPHAGQVWAREHAWSTSGHVASQRGRFEHQVAQTLRVRADASA
jgi:hypothetical protein